MPELQQQPALNSTKRVEIAVDLLLECLANALEVMAFVMVGPAEPWPAAPADPQRVKISFTGAANGTVELVVGSVLGQQLATNALGADTEEPINVGRASDAVAELANIVCGSLLSRLNGGEFEMGLPEVQAFDAIDEWDRFVASAGSCVVDADGTSLALRVVAFN